MRTRSCSIRASRSPSTRPRMQGRQGAANAYIERMAQGRSASCGDDLEAEAHDEAERLEADYTKEPLIAAGASTRWCCEPGRRERTAASP